MLGTELNEILWEVLSIFQDIILSHKLIVLFLQQSRS
nr:MAG TPA: hypothetical protein [Crassvirales sp.]DAS25771.1 MAG TPA: hypothetical protein [Caudoviricetes sp.]